MYLCLIITIDRVPLYYSHFIGHLLSRYRRISDYLYSIVKRQAGRYAPYRPATITARIARYNVAYLPLEPSGYATVPAQRRCPLTRRSELARELIVNI